MEIKNNSIIIVVLMSCLALALSISFAQNTTLENTTSSNSTQIDYGAQSSSNTPASGRHVIDSPGNLEDGLVSYYSFDESSPSYAILDSPVQSQGIISNAYEFNCQGGKDVCPQIRDNLMFLDDASEFTYSFWVYVEEYPITQAAIIGEYGSNDGYTRNYAFINLNGEIGFDQHPNSGGFTYSSFIVPKDSWNHISITKKNDVVNVYLNGNLEETYSHSEVYSGTAPVHFGMGSRTHKAVNRYGLDGSLDEVGIWNRELSVQEISELYNSGNAVEFDHENSKFNQGDEVLDKADALVIIREEFSNELSLVNLEENMNIFMEHSSGQIEETTIDLLYSTESKRYLVSYGSNLDELSSMGTVINVLQIEPTTEVNLRSQVQEFISN